ncbi:hypothetical protein FOZ60_015415 [Perkinsus olseni]|uniref:RRM domain-containing protein n=1 Tax=Perkinsus olseni TaxID=32597 RepID=A0A7J6N5D8_PEROL|nr:hypothetical protein FOZ60_015415 [Perkinsus olseni]
MQPVGPLQDLPNDDTSSSMGPSQLGGVAGSGLSAVDLERVHDSSFKRAKDTQLPAGGAFMGHADSRSVGMFLQEAYYLEFPLDVSVRGVISGIVDKVLKQRGLEDYDALVARAAAIESALRARFDSINSHRILADRWESIRWNISDDFEKFFLEFQEIRDSYSRQRERELRGADVVERLFGPLPKELADRLIRQYGELQILELRRRENMILTRNRAMKNGPSRSTTRSNINSVYVKEDDDRLKQRPDGFFVMPVEQTSTSAQTNNRLLVSNLAFSASGRDLLGAFRSVLRLSGPVPRGIRLFKDGRNKSRGIGLIEFDTADAATRALGVVDGQQVLGRKVRARRDRGASSSAPSSGSSSETPSGSASCAKRRRTGDGSGAAAAANAPQGATGDTEGSGNSVDVRREQPEDQSCDTCDADGALEAEDQSPDTTPLLSRTVPFVCCRDSGLRSCGIHIVDHQNADIDVELCELGQGSVAGKPLTTVCSLVSVRAGYDTTNKVDWLLDSGCALHLIDKNTHP